MNKTITLYLTTNDKAAKSATVELNGDTLTINGKTVDTDKIYYTNSYYGNSGYKLYLWTGYTVYLFTMTDGWAEMYDASPDPIDADPLNIILGVVNLFAVEDNSWMRKVDERMNKEVN